MVMTMNEEFDTKTDKRARARHKARTSQIGTPITKVRTTTEIELRNKLRRLKRKGKEGEKESRWATGT
jgi:hypothetical protein